MYMLYKKTDRSLIYKASHLTNWDHKLSKNKYQFRKIYERYGNSPYYTDEYTDALVIKSVNLNPKKDYYD